MPWSVDARSHARFGLELLARLTRERCLVCGAAVEIVDARSACPACCGLARPVFEVAPGIHASLEPYLVFEIPFLI